jgi:hypothetical protein
MLPERVVTKKTGGGQIKSNMGKKQKLWMCSGFRLKIDGVQDVEYANKIESFTIKQGTRKFYTGEERFPQIEPTKIEFPGINGTISLGYADGLIKWYDQYVHKGMADPKAQKNGSLEFLGPDRGEVIFRIQLYEVGLHHLAMVPSQANADSSKRMKFELYVGRMDLDGGGSLGME